MVRKYPLRLNRDNLLDEILKETARIRIRFLEFLRTAPTTACLRIPDAGKPADNPQLVFDRWAEEQIKTHLFNCFDERSLIVIGEEDPEIKTADFREETSTVVLVDMIDGSDLALLGLGNWCSAAVCFSPATTQIESAVVMHADGTRYHATSNGAFVDRLVDSWRRRKVAKANAKVKALSEAKICYYGQKGNRTLVGAEELYEALGNRGRIYNLAGNPMMAKLAEGKVDAVFDVGGQKAYDVVPGAYIAMRGGATVGRVDGRLLREADLMEQLLEPYREMTYVIAGSPELYSQLCDKLRLVRTLECPASEGC